MVIYVLVIEHRHGMDVSVHRTERAATAALADYAREQWNNELPRQTCPANADNCIAEYFDKVDEYWNVTRHDLP